MARPKKQKIERITCPTMSDEEFAAIELRRREYWKLLKNPTPSHLSAEDQAFINEQRAPGGSEVKFYSEERIQKLKKLFKEA